MSRISLAAALVALLATAIPAAGAATPPATLGPGSAGPAVRALQQRLAALRYLPAAAVDGRYGNRTWHAVVAFQGWSALPRDGLAGPRTRSALRTALRPVPWSRTRGMEVHLGAQVLMLVSGGAVQRVIHVSTGIGGTTPVGRFRVQRRERLSWSARFRTWMPYAQYFTGGYALHEYPSVPAYPASHGCVRLPAPEAQVAWAFGARGMRVWVGSGAGPRAVAAARTVAARAAACVD